jgi:ATP-binding cassette subfamily C (CFTR/MRP) protein 4
VSLLHLIRSRQSHASSTGLIVNLISNDVQRFEDAGPYFPFLFSTPVEVLASMVFMYYLLGPSSLGMKSIF